MIVTVKVCQPEPFNCRKSRFPAFFSKPEGQARTRSEWTIVSIIRIDLTLSVVSFRIADIGGASERWTLQEPTDVKGLEKSCGVR